MLQALLKKVMVQSPSKKLSVFYGIEKFIAVSQELGNDHYSENDVKWEHF